MTQHINLYDHIIYLLQGGGALGSYQVGVCEALIENNCPPNWIVGTSIGAINGAIIAGNKPKYRIAKLHEFWNMISYPFYDFIGQEENVLLQKLQNFLCAQYIATFGLPNFFQPRIFNPFFLSNTTPDNISFYDTSALRTTLNKVINFDLINQKKVRLTLGAVKIKGGEMVFFDNFYQEITLDHVMASSALPPGFPAVKIGNDYYWDGGLSSNTPFSVILKERFPKKLLCFIVNLFTFPIYEPSSMFDVLKYKKEITFASRHQKVLHYFNEIYYLQHAIHLLEKIGKSSLDFQQVLDKMKQQGHPTALNTIIFHYHHDSNNLWSKDYNFAISEIKEHWQAGYENVIKVLDNPPWLNPIDDDSGAVVHEY